jgi:hypothetical protein
MSAITVKVVTTFIRFSAKAPVADIAVMAAMAVVLRNRDVIQFSFKWNKLHANANHSQLSIAIANHLHKAFQLIKELCKKFRSVK